MADPILGVIFHWIGGLAAASFYLPYKRTRGWSWETYWLVGGLFSWILAPVFFSVLLVPDTFSILANTPAKTLVWTFVFGLLWGIGGLTFGLTVRYLGLALGYAIALGCCAAFGTLIPPMFNGELPHIAASMGGRVTLLGVLVCLIGIVLSGLAGLSKESECSAEQKRATVAEFDFSKGLIVALVCGVMSACMAFAFAAGKPIGDLAQAKLSESHALDVWQKLPILIVVLAGGFATNLLWCAYLHIRNKSASEYMLGILPERKSGLLMTNYLFSAIAGVMWYFQFFFYSMGETKMGQYGFSSWTLHMASIIIFSTLWGIALHEWAGASKRTRTYIIAGLLTLTASTFLVGLGQYLSIGKA